MAKNMQSNEPQHRASVWKRPASTMNESRQKAARAPPARPWCASNGRSHPSSCAQAPPMRLPNVPDRNDNDNETMMDMRTTPFECAMVRSPSRGSLNQQWRFMPGACLAHPACLGSTDGLVTFGIACLVKQGADGTGPRAKFHSERLSGDLRATLAPNLLPR